MSAFNASSTTIEVKIPSFKVGLVTGKNGEIIKQLQEENGVEISLDQENGEQTIADRPICITGERERVAYVQSQIQRLIVVSANNNFDILK